MSKWYGGQGRGQGGSQGRKNNKKLLKSKFWFLLYEETFYVQLNPAIMDLPVMEIRLYRKPILSPLSSFSFIFFGLQ